MAQGGPSDPILHRIQRQIVLGRRTAAGFARVTSGGPV